MLRLQFRLVFGFAFFTMLFTMLIGPPLQLAAQEKAVAGKGKDLAKSNDLYFMLLFSQQSDPPAPRLSHTFAAFVQARRAPGQKDYRLETHSISWLPATLDVRLLRRPEQGRNLGLKASLENARSAGTRISMWGPFQIPKQLYDRALKQETRLNRGELLYKALDGALRPEREAVNCFHAVADIDTERGLLETGTAHGDAATEMVAQHLRRSIIDPERTHDWVADRLGLKNYTITRRKMTGAIAERE
jgi:hypothetical protein